LFPANFSLTGEDEAAHLLVVEETPIKGELEGENS
jgi:hypothetical protein